jgi:hypothetical protein
MSLPPRPGSHDGDSAKSADEGQAESTIALAEERPSSSRGVQQTVGGRGEASRLTENMPPTRTPLQRPAVLRGFREPSIRLRRTGQLGTRDDSSISTTSNLSVPLPPITSSSGRRSPNTVPTRGRSKSEPQHPMLLQQAKATAPPSPRRPSPAAHMPVLLEETSAGVVPLPELPDDVSIAGSAPPQLEPGRVNREMADILDAVGKYSSQVPL